MEKIFTPNKWFVAFCGLLVVVFLSLKWVINMRIADEAKEIGQEIFTWKWDSLNWQSSAEMTGAEVLRVTDTDAIVKVQGKQVLTRSSGDGQNEAGQPKREVVDCGATLTFYKSSNKWKLGKVELQ